MLSALLDSQSQAFILWNAQPSDGSQGVGVCLLDLRTMTFLSPLPTD